MIHSNSGSYMKTLRILPGAAGIIALTATIGFVDGQRERESISREEPHVRVMMLATSDLTQADNSIIPEADNPAYLVKVENGDLTRDVLIDAITGNILKA
jgi:hypothetical protein